MDKVKKIFSPGSKKDDEVLYGDAEQRRRESASKAPETQQPEQLRPVEGSQQKEHSIMRQLVNPGGEKFDEQRFGTTATTDPADANKLETHPEAAKKDHTILDQVLNPHHDKYDPQQFEGTTTTGGGRRESVRPEAPPIAGSDVKLETDPQEKKHEHSILRQILNPGGDKYDQEGYGTTAHAAGSLGNAPSDTKDHVGSKDHSVARQILNPGQEKYDPVVHGGSGEPTSSSAAGTVGGMISRPTKEEDSASCLSIKSGVAGPFARGADEHGLGASSTTAGQSSMATEQGTNFGRDAAVVGGGAAAAGAGAAAYSHDKPKDVPSTTTTTTSTTSHPTPATTTSQHTQPLADRSTAAPASTTAPTTGDSHLGRDAAVAGGAGLAGGAAYSQLNKPKDEEFATSQPSQPLADRSVAGGSHVNPVGAPESTTAKTTGDSHLGRDAALAGGAGLAGGAAYGQLNKPKDDVAAATSAERSQPLAGESQKYTPESSRATGTGPAHFGTESTTTPAIGATTSTGGAHINPIGAPEASLEGQPRLGQDAALAGGVGAAGIAAGSGVTQLNKAPKDVQQATYTERAYPVGSASHNDGVIHHTGGPHSTETANRLDPHVPGEFPSQTGEDRHGLNPTAVDGASTAAAGASSTTDPALGNENEKQTLGSRILSAVGLSGKKGDETTAAEPTTATGKDYAGSQPLTGTAAATEEPKEHHYGRDAAVVGGLGAAGAGTYAATRDHDSQRPGEPSLGSDSTSQPIGSTTGKDYASTQPLSDTATTTEQPKEHHYGRDAAVVGGLGAAGAGTYAATRDHDSQAPGQSYSGSTSTSQPITTTTNTTTTATGPTASQTADVPTSQSKSHMGRDAALAGGAGAAGVGAYEASKDTGPASKTIGPHDSNVANIMDPRVQPEPEKMKESTTTGPYSSDMANKADPRVQADPAKETHYGRDAAVAGGVGAAGAGAYAATKDDKPHTHSQTESNDPAVIAARKAAHKDSHPSTSDKHDKSHAEEGGKKKHSLLDKILHPGRKSEDKAEEKAQEKEGHHFSEARTATDDHGHTKLHKKAVEQPSDTAPSGQVIEPHTGLPMNVEKYGTTGAGGTDGATQIGGYEGHAGDGVAGPDWDAVKKANTPY